MVKSIVDLPIYLLHPNKQDRDVYIAAGKNHVIKHTSLTQTAQFTNENISRRSREILDVAFIKDTSRVSWFSGIKSRDEASGYQLPQSPSGPRLIKLASAAARELDHSQEIARAIRGGGAAKNWVKEFDSPGPVSSLAIVNTSSGFGYEL